MTAASPPPGLIGRSDGFQPFGVVSRYGAHVTLQAGIVVAGRYWTTTARSSFKRRAVRAVRDASAAVTDAATVTVFTGRTAILDALDPGPALSDPGAMMMSGVALGRIGLDHLRQLAGYVEAATVPAEWQPTNRVILATRLSHVVRYDREGIVHAAGAFASPRRRRVTERPRRSQWSAGVDRLPVRVGALLDDIGDGSGDHGTQCSVGFTTRVGPVTIPARWDAERARAVMPRHVTERLTDLAVDDLGGSCITLDCSGGRRPDTKYGLMLRGAGHLGQIDADEVAMSVAADRITHWDGFSSATVGAGDRAAIVA